MATTVTATSTAVKPKQEVKVAKRPSRGPPAIDAQGKKIPHTARWGYSTAAFANGEIRSNLFTLSQILLFAAWNQTQSARNLYIYLEKNFSAFFINSYGSFLLTTVLYWAVAGIFAFVDLTGYPKFLFKYKVQPFHRVNGKEYLDIAAIVLRNQIFVVLPLLYIRGATFPATIDSDKVNGFWSTVFNLVFNIICTEIGFYFIHRFFHSPWMYQRFHKQHHRMTAPVALSATYCTMTEHIFSNLLPNVIGTTILRPHWSVGICTFCILSLSTLCAHSGYNIPFLHSSLQHDWHHFAFNENFGPTGILDTLLGTASRFDSVLQDGLKRHNGKPDKAREELLSQLASWEVESSEQDDVSSLASSST